ncbi:EamA family transporter [Candidatus Woesearchaeota archaeon]|nr:EamA family transporter [Candidatus Woesearchaeota archaeon]
MNVELWALILVLFATIFGAFGPIFFKRGSRNFKLMTIYKNYNFILGIIFYGVGTLLFIPALKGGELSIIYPLVSLSYIWVSLLSVKMIGEKMNKFKWMGILLIIIGVTCIGVGS